MQQLAFAVQETQAQEQQTEMQEKIYLLIRQIQEHEQSKQHSEKQVREKNILS